MTTIGGIDPNFPAQGAGGEPPYVRLPAPRALFARRAQRFSAVAAGSEIADYLAFLAEVARAQDALAARTVAPEPDPSVYDVIAHGMPPLTRALAADPAAVATLDGLLVHLAAAPIGEGPSAIVAGLAAAQPEDRARLLTSVADGLYEVERLADCALAAAALQVWYAAHAARLEAGRLRNIGEVICPCCGGAPASSTIVNWPEAEGARYLACSLCLTMWNHVRIKCTACGATKDVSYRSVEGSAGDVAAEVCETCRSYAKHLVLTKNAQLDPIADDVASYGLDLLLREDGWRRGGLDPFLMLP